MRNMNIKSASLIEKAKCQHHGNNMIINRAFCNMQWIHLGCHPNVDIFSRCFNSFSKKDFLFGRVFGWTNFLFSHSVGIVNNILLSKRSSKCKQNVKRNTNVFTMHWIYHFVACAFLNIFSPFELRAIRWLFLHWFNSDIHIFQTHGYMIKQRSGFCDQLPMTITELLQFLSSLTHKSYQNVTIKTIVMRGN